MKYYLKHLLSLIIFLGLATSLILSPNNAQAADNITGQMIKALGGNGGTEIALPGLEGKEGRVEVIVGGIIQTFLSIFGIIFLGLMVYGGYKWMIAQGREEELMKAKAIIRSSIIGLAVVLSAYAIALFVVAQFYRAASGG